MKYAHLMLAFIAILFISACGGGASSAVSNGAGIMPTVSSFTPTSGTVGTPVTITGTNFNTTFSSNTVKFNGVQAIVTGGTASSLAVTVPNFASTGTVSVTTTGGTGTSIGNFTVSTGGGSSTYSPIPANGIFYDLANDTAIDFIDITGASLAIDSTNINFQITLRNLPTSLTFNQANVSINDLEYIWEVEFDIDNDNVTDYSLSVSHYKSSNTSISGSILSNSQINAWKHLTGGGASYLASASASITGNTINLAVTKSVHPDLANITSSAKVKINTYYLSNSATASFSDSIGTSGTGNAITATATTTTQNLTVGTAMASFLPLTPSGGATPYTYSYTGTLPIGLSFNTSTGAVTGTPTATYATASLVFSVREANNNYASTTSTVSFTVGAAYVVQGGLTWMPVTFFDTWTNANAYCANTTINGQTGWRLPTQLELSALYASGAMNGQGWALYDTWSSTVYIAGIHYGVGLFHGNVYWLPDALYFYVSCVR